MQPNSFQQWLLEEPRTMRLRRTMLGDLNPEYVRLRFLYCGLCGSDLSKFLGRPPVESYPRSLGHEFLAEVVAVGSGVIRLAPGDLVTSDLNYRCGTCEHCRIGRSHLCLENDRSAFTNRGFAEFGDLHADYLLRLPMVPGPHLALSEPLSCVLHAKAWAGPSSSDRVLLIGAGGIGMCLAFALCHDPSSASFDVIEVIPSRASSIASAIGPVGQVVQEPRGQYDVVFDVSGSESGLREALSRVKPGGRLCSMSHLDGQTNGEFLLGALTRTDVVFKVSYLNGQPDSLVNAARLLDAGWNTQWDRLIDVVSFERTAEAFVSRSESPHCKTVIQIARA